MYDKLESREYKMAEKEYDCIISLGCNCSVALQLKRRQLRSFSLPLDWLLFENKTFIDNIIKLIKTDFADFLRFENLEFTDRSDEIEKHVVYTHKVYDKGSNAVFLHDFRMTPLNQEEYRAVSEKYKRRIMRFYNVCSMGGGGYCLCCAVVQNKFQKKT